MKKVLQGTFMEEVDLEWVLRIGKVSPAAVTVLGIGQRKTPRQKREVTVFRDFLRNC